MSASKKNSRRWARAFAAFLLSAAALAAAAEQVYRWKDANGQWHYGNRAPEGVAAEPVTIRPGPTPEAPPPLPPPEGSVDAPPDAAATAATPATPVIAPRTVREVQRGCSTIVNACAVPNGPDRATCLASVRQCAADPTMERQDCCPAACGLRYAELRSQGLPEGLAFTRAVYGVPSCVPGGDDAVIQPDPDSQPLN